MNEQLKSKVAGQEMGSIQRKPYATPVVENFGNIRVITKSLGANGNMDGAGGNPMFTMV